MPLLAPHYQLVVSRDGHLDEMEVHVRDATRGRRRDPDRLAMPRRRSSSTTSRSCIGISTRVNVLPPNSIERTLTGKARRVVDKRPKADDTDESDHVHGVQAMYAQMVQGRGATHVKAVVPRR